VYYLLGEGERAEPEARPGLGWQPTPPRGAHSPGGGSGPQDGVPPQHPLHLPPRHSGQLTTPRTHIAFNCSREPKLYCLPEPEPKLLIAAPAPAPFYLPQTLRNFIDKKIMVA
jgi:hypothetical protein